MSAASSAVSALLEKTPPHPGGGIVLCLDGRAGSGKSTVAAEVDFAGRITVVHTDALCPGWDGLPRVPGILADLLAPLAEGRAGSYPRYDWIEGRISGRVVVEPADLVIVEGVGAGARSLRPHRSVLAWLECPTATRKNRALARDGASFAPYWDAWAEAESRYLATEADRDAADLVLRT